MRQLFWKEWREQRWLPLIMTAVTLAVNGVWAYIAYRSHLPTTLAMNHVPAVFNGRPYAAASANTQVIVEGSGLILLALWGISGALAGAGSVAAEVGNKTLPFLFSLPVRRETLWRVKVLTAVGTLTATILLSGICWFGMDAALYGPHFLMAARAAGVPIGFHVEIAPTLEFSALALACALAVSTFVDRTLSALLSAVVTGPIVFIALSASAEWALKHVFPAFSERQAQAGEGSLPLLLTGILTAVSYVVFVHGGSLTTARRFKIGAITGGAALVTASAAFLLTAPWLANGH